MQWPRSTLTFKSDIPHTPAKSSDHDSYKYKTFFQCLFSKTATKKPTIINTLRKYFTTKTTNTKSLKYPNANPQINNNNDAKYPKRSKTISKTATLIKKIKKATTKKFQKLSKKTTRQKQTINLNQTKKYHTHHHTHQYIIPSFCRIFMY